jgi:hypothetical protein
MAKPKQAPVPAKNEYVEIDLTLLADRLNNGEHKSGTVYTLIEQLSSDRVVSDKDRREPTPAAVDHEVVKRCLPRYSYVCVDTGLKFEALRLWNGTIVWPSGAGKFSSAAMSATHSRRRRLQFGDAVDDWFAKILAGDSSPHLTIIFVESSYPLKQTVLQAWVTRGFIVVFVSGVMTSQRCGICSKTSTTRPRSCQCACAAPPSAETSPPPPSRPSTSDATFAFVDDDNIQINVEPTPTAPPPPTARATRRRPKSRCCPRRAPRSRSTTSRSRSAIIYPLTASRST